MGKDGRDFSLKEDEDRFGVNEWTGILGEVAGKVGPIVGGIVAEELRGNEF